MTKDKKDTIIEKQPIQTNKSRVKNQKQHPIFRLIFLFNCKIKMYEDEISFVTISVFQQKYDQKKQQKNRVRHKELSTRTKSTKPEKKYKKNHNIKHYCLFNHTNKILIIHNNNFHHKN